jgi:hypothetical protein
MNYARLWYTNRLSTRIVDHLIAETTTLLLIVVEFGVWVVHAAGWWWVDWVVNVLVGGLRADSVHTEESSTTTTLAINHGDGNVVVASVKKSNTMTVLGAVKTLPSIGNVHQIT